MKASFTDSIVTDPDEWRRARVLRGITRFAPVIPASTFAATIAVMLCLWPVVSHALLTAWFHIALVLNAVLAVAAHAAHHRRLCVAQLDTSAWRRRLIWGSLGTGVFWAATSIVLFPLESPLHQGLLALILAVVATPWLPLLVLERVTLFTLAAPVLLPMACILLLSPTAAPLAPMGSLLLLLFAAYFIVAGTIRRLLDADYATHRELYHQATHDTLVGLLNHAEFQRCVTALESAPPGPYAVVYIDLDRFKEINDTAGHGAGDRLLQRVGAILREEKRRADVAARVGGDEFVILMGLCNDREAMRVALSVLKRIDEITLSHAGRVLSVTASIGVACSWDAPVSGRSVLEAADQACYAAKRAGRNRIELAREHGRGARNCVVPRIGRGVEAARAHSLRIGEGSDGAAFSSVG
jgi:diguanylate cyclase (GGDEF)-like protein